MYWLSALVSLLCFISLYGAQANLSNMIGSNWNLVTHIRRMTICYAAIFWLSVLLMTGYDKVFVNAFQ